MSDPEKKKNGHGGARAGAGAKPKAITLLKQRKLADSEAEAEKAFDLIVQFAQDPKRPDEFRRDCANDIMDRIWGKAKNISELTGKNGAPLNPPKVDLTGLDMETLRKIAEGNI